MGDLKHSELTQQIIGAFYEVYGELGIGFLEEVYRHAMAVELEDKGLKVILRAPIAVWYRSRQVGNYQPDLLVENRVIVELKACRCFEPAHEAQLLNYLRATEIEVGLLLNFGTKPQIKRMAFNNERKSHRAKVDPTDQS
jgi:GxxExxY protein